MAEYAGEESPGAAVGVIRDGEVAFVEGYGMADLTHEAPITPETRFNLGSASKQFLAFALALLEAYGTLALAGRITGRDHLPKEEALEVVRRQPALEWETRARRATESAPAS